MSGGRLQSAIAERTGRKHALVVGRGTTAIYLVLKASGLRGAKIVVPDTICLDVANAVVYSGNVPVFCDVSMDDCNIGAAHVKKVLSPDVKAVIAAHMYGNPAPMDELTGFCAERNVMLIEDAALALGASLGGRPAGSFGRASILSFGYSKIIDAGMGGAVATDDVELYERMRAECRELPLCNEQTLARIGEYGRINRLLVKYAPANRGLYGLYPLLNRIYRPNYLFSLPPRYAPLIEKGFGALDENVSSRNRKAEIYDSLLRGHTNIALLKHEMGSVCWRFSFLLKERRDEIVEEARSRGIGISAWYPPLHRMYPDSGGAPDGDFPNASYVGGHVANLWVDSSVSEQDVRTTAEWLLSALSPRSPAAP